MTEKEAITILCDHIKGLKSHINQLTDLVNKHCDIQLRTVQGLTDLKQRIEALEFKKSFGKEDE